METGVGPRITEYDMTEKEMKGADLRHIRWRKLEIKANRWVSFDRYNGSMNTSNPQSFNRYGYVGKDFVNFDKSL